MLREASEPPPWRRGILLRRARMGGRLAPAAGPGARVRNTTEGEDSEGKGKHGRASSVSGRGAASGARQSHFQCEDDYERDQWIEEIN